MAQTRFVLTLLAQVYYKVPASAGLLFFACHIFTKRLRRTLLMKHAAIVVCRFVCISLGLLGLVQRCTAQASLQSQDRLRVALEARVVQRPQDANAWRLLGRLRLKMGEPQAALSAFQRSVELDPQSAAAHCDLAGALLTQGTSDGAASHFRQAIGLAPESDYAQTARAQLIQLGFLSEPEVSLVSYEIKSFDGSDTAENLGVEDIPPDPAASPLSLKLEAGLLYNTNVILTPISRELAPEERASFQGLINPALEYRLLDNGVWRSGPAFQAYWNANEDDFKTLNVQSYQPGWFVERSVFLESATLVPRVQYDFTQDLFDGLEFGSRHALTMALSRYPHEGGLSLLYSKIDEADFVDDGLAPEITSRDGFTGAIGFSRTYCVNLAHLAAVRGGFEVQRADTEGSDFRYNGVSVYGDSEMPLFWKTSLILEGGWGYRDYPDFELSPSRNENIWRAAAKLRHRLTDHWSLSAVFNYDRFDSENELYAAERSISGIVTTVEY